MKYLIPTIDVEALRSLSRLGNFDQLILGKIGKEFFGATKIAEIISEYGGSGTFYIDFAEKDHGLHKLKSLSEEIKNIGSDVQLHIHPQFIADNNRYLMNQYSKVEQSHIFNECIDIYRSCTGEHPISFRAGGYGADDHTLEILREKQIKIDSSYFFGHEWCKISHLPVNKISYLDSLIEIPVTVFKNNISYEFLGKGIRSKSLIKKLDIDGCTKEELEKGFNSLNQAGVRIIILFLHSFSLFTRSYDYTQIKPDYNDVHKLKFILEHAISSGYTISSIRQLMDSLNNYLNERSVIPHVNTDRNIIASTNNTFKKFIRKKLRGK